ncbi:aminotransferase class I/II-fold pyridoxal phosphate-dependent enzyme [Nocardia goodfellowii]|uniref:8-amino-7-oxononanoate synthase n=1 Tax=Nocardia goodfellowii TaxID=882446 RepID=A0ABS4QQR6_9NOCA|nr:pyridoxal phosphate-dependent aminotransferase family protein [Nocardia goodfellowii]MBP2192986.1 8-amino-7-oxononanoate synthase [Nocardia goodfellowii]
MTSSEHPGNSAMSRLTARIDSGAGDLDSTGEQTTMYDATIEEVDGRNIRIGDKWLADFASCNYLGFDLNQEIIAASQEAIERWGTHPSWSRLLGNPALYPEIEERLTDLLHAADSLVLPTITLIHTAVLPMLAEGGAILLERRAHKTLYDTAVIAKNQGTYLERFRQEDLDAFADQLRKARAAIGAGQPLLVCLDGLNSMTGNVPPLAEMTALCERQGAILYVDDAHGFGVLGENPSPALPYGYRGNSVVRHLDQGYDNLILVGGFSKAYSAILAFIALPTALKEKLKYSAPPYLYSGPSPTASLAGVLAGFEVNDRDGDLIRADLYGKTRRVLDHLDALGIGTPNVSGSPIIEIPVAEPEKVPQAAELLWDNGIYVTVAAYPLVPKKEAGFRIQMTAANTTDHVERLCGTLSALVDQNIIITQPDRETGHA